VPCRMTACAHSPGTPDERGSDGQRHRCDDNDPEPLRSRNRRGRLPLLHHQAQRRLGQNLGFCILGRWHHRGSGPGDRDSNAQPRVADSLANSTWRILRGVAGPASWLPPAATMYLAGRGQLHARVSHAGPPQRKAQPATRAGRGARSRLRPHLGQWSDRCSCWRRSRSWFVWLDHPVRPVTRGAPKLARSGTGMNIMAKVTKTSQKSPRGWPAGADRRPVDGRCRLTAAATTQAGRTTSTRASRPKLRC
jgi:hypothetical protein